MKKILVAVAVAGLVGTANAQSAFEGFYGQISTGYESNTATGLNSNVSASGSGLTINSIGSTSAGNQTFGGVPIIIGLGYNFSVAPKWLLGIGVDYSLLSQESSSFSYSGQLNSIETGEAFPGTLSGAKLKASNRLNIFITPGYEIDKDKLVYLKAGYSSIKVDATAPTSVTSNGTTAPISDPNNGFGAAFSNPSQTLNGYIIGVGYKQIINKGLYAFGEANYMSYNKSNFNSSLTIPNSGGVSVTSTSNSGLNSYQFLVGVGYRF